MDDKFDKALDCFRRSVSDNIKLAEEQKNLFLELFRDPAVGSAVKKAWSTDLDASQNLIVSPFGKIGLKFLLVPEFGAMSYAVVFWYADDHGNKVDLYRVLLKHSERPWLDSTKNPTPRLPWDEDDRVSDVTTMSEVLRRAIAALAHHNEIRVMSI